MGLPRVSKINDQSLNAIDASADPATSIQVEERVVPITTDPLMLALHASRAASQRLRSECDPQTRADVALKSCGEILSGVRSRLQAVAPVASNSRPSNVIPITTDPEAQFAATIAALRVRSESRLKRCRLLASRIARIIADPVSLALADARAQSAALLSLGGDPRPWPSSVIPFPFDAQAALDAQLETRQAEIASELDAVLAEMAYEESHHITT